MIESETQKRQIAQKCSIIELLEGTLVKDLGFEPSYVITKQGRKIARGNILGVIVSKTNTDFYESILMDDNTGRISIKSFDKKKVFETLPVGAVILLVGRVREYNSERYIAYEIAKIITNMQFLELRKLELELIKKTFTPTKIVEKNEKINSQEEFIQEEIILNTDTVLDEDKGPVQKMYEIIKEIDKGQGADYEEILKLAKMTNGEEVIMNLIKNGDVFEVKPGKIKVLD